MATLKAEHESAIATYPAKFWNAYAKVYGSVENLVPHQNMLHDVAALVPKDARTILDVGCGSGALLQFLRRRDASLELHGIDFSTEMLAKAQERVPGVMTQVADFNQDLPFADSQFDCVVSSNAMYAVSDPAHFVAELRRVTQSGGTIVVTSPKNSAKGTQILACHLKQVTLGRGLIDMLRFSTCIAPNILIERLARKNNYHFFSLDEIHSLIGDGKVYPDTFAGQNWLFTISP